MCHGWWSWDAQAWNSWTHFRDLTWRNSGVVRVFGDDRIVRACLGMDFCIVARLEL